MAGPTTTPGPAQSKNQALAAAGSSIAIIMGANVVSGNTLVLLAGLSASGSFVVRITDPQNNAYTLQSSAFLYSGTGGSYLPNGRVFLYTAVNIVGGFTTYTVYLSGGTALISSLTREMSGVIKAPVANQAVSGYSAVAQPYKSQFITPPQPNCIGYAWYADKGTLAGTPSGGFINILSQTSLSGASVSMADLLVSTPVASSSYWNAAGTTNCQVGLLYLKGRFDDEGNNLCAGGCG